MSEIWITIAIAILTLLFTVIGFLIIEILREIKTGISTLSVGLQKTSVDLATFVAKTETILEGHEKRIEAQEDAILLLRGRF